MFMIKFIENIIMENYQGLGLGYTNLVLINSSYHTQPHSIIVNYSIAVKRNLELEHELFHEHEGLYKETSAII